MIQPSYTPSTLNPTQVALPRLKLKVLYEAEQTQPGLEDNDWLLERRVQLWPCCRGLAAPPRFLTPS